MKLVKAHTDTDTDLLLSVKMSEGTRSCPIIRGVVGLHSKATPQLTGKTYAHPGLLYLAVTCISLALHAKYMYLKDNSGLNSLAYNLLHSFIY